jgi:hypothetical protein
VIFHKRISGIHAATWQEKLEANLSRFQARLRAESGEAPLYLLTNEPIKIECSTMLERFARDNHTISMCLFVSCEENEVL